MGFSILPVTTIEQCRAIEQLQLDIWGCNSLEVTPDHILLTVAKEGGVVLLALDEEENPIGFTFGFVALTADNRLKLASHQAGVLPTHQSSGIGYGLKLAQREAALSRRIDLVTWTFDPLEGRNARLNLRKLGAVCNTYLRELYGEMRDELNQGLPTDRFKVDWWLNSDHVVSRLDHPPPEPVWPAADCPILNPAIVLQYSFLWPADTFDLAGTKFCLVEIPADIQRLKLEALDLALQWRLQTRQIFEAAFDSGYTAVDLLRREGRNYYLLQRDWQA